MLGEIDELLALVLEAEMCQHECDVLPLLDHWSELRPARVVSLCSMWLLLLMQKAALCEDDWVLAQLLRPGLEYMRGGVAVECKQWRAHSFCDRSACLAEACQLNPRQPCKLPFQLLPFAHKGIPSCGHRVEARVAGASNLLCDVVKVAKGTLHGDKAVVVLVAFVAQELVAGEVLGGTQEVLRKHGCFGARHEHVRGLAP